MTPPLLLEQPALLGFCGVTDAIECMSRAGDLEARGAVYTRREIVDFILDLVGYTETEPLYSRSLLEPSFGGGDFLLPAIDRLLAARSRSLKAGCKVDDLADCIRAVELHGATFDATREQVIERLKTAEFSPRQAGKLADVWLIDSDFLLSDLPCDFDVVVGNPPYVRQELIPSALLTEYRKRFRTLYDRADLYIPFIERSLGLLAPGGQLSFICADRWMKNRYGGPLRELVASKFNLRVYVDMVDTPAFHSDVIAYPAITVIGRDMPGPTRLAARPPVDAAALKTLAKSLRGESVMLDARVHELANVAVNDAPWMLHAQDTLTLVRRIEGMFPTLEEAGCKVGIGVATGADKAYVGTFEELDVELDRKIPLAMTSDILTGRVQWRGNWVINPFTDQGPLVDLASYPKLRGYLEARRTQIASRHVAKKTPANWFRTIDRITPSLAAKQKLLIPDIKGEAQVVFEEGKLYPHHNLYFVTSNTWDLKALQALLLSKLTRLFVASYSTKMRGGFLRFQAQYLRRIRVPMWESVPEDLRQRLASAAERLDLPDCDRAAAELYRLTPSEKELLAAI